MDFVFNERDCTLCPRKCHGDRTLSGGVCRSPNKIRLARAALHFFEEPCISGTRGSGAIFFSGCPLRCSFCQNILLSRDAFGKDISIDRFQKICFELKAQGAHNINLVTPCHYAPYIKDALAEIKDSLALPIIVNTGGYDSASQIDCFDNITDVYLPDFKFPDSKSADFFAKAPNYPEVALDAIEKMKAQVGDIIMGEDNLIRRGLIVRHLVIPGKRKESVEAIKALCSRLGTKGYFLSLMSQYTPMGVSDAPNRRITSFEYDSVVDYALSLGFDGFCQEKSSAKKEYTPDFDLTGV